MPPLRAAPPPHPQSHVPLSAPLDAAYLMKTILIIIIFITLITICITVFITILIILILLLPMPAALAPCSTVRVGCSRNCSRRWFGKQGLAPRATARHTKPFVLSGLQKQTNAYLVHSNKSCTPPPTPHNLPYPSFCLPLHAATGSSRQRQYLFQACWCATAGAVDGGAFHTSSTDSYCSAQKTFVNCCFGEALCKHPPPPSLCPPPLPPNAAT